MKKTHTDLEIVSIRKNRYLIHKGLRTKKINLYEWRKLLNQNYNSDEKGRKIIYDYLNNLPENRTMDQEFKKAEFLLIIHESIKSSLLLIFILFMIWGIALKLYLTKTL